MTGLPIIGGEGAANTAAPIPWFWELPEHLSATQLSMFKRCPEQWRQRYVLKKKEAPGAALVLGIAFHGAAELNFKQKIESHVDLPVGDVQERFASSFEEAVDEKGGNGEIAWDGSPGEVKDQGVAMVRLYHDQQAPTIQPIAVEQELNITLEGVPVPLNAKLDIIEEGVIRDMKTSNKKPPKETLKSDWLLQDAVYKFGVPKDSRWDVVTKTKTPMVYSVEQGYLGLGVPYTPQRSAIWKASIYRTVANISRCMEVYGPDLPWPDAMDHPWACGFCGFRADCPWWGNS